MNFGEGVYDFILRLHGTEPVAVNVSSWDFPPLDVLVYIGLGAH
jgi:hypothetical protein